MMTLSNKFKASTGCKMLVKRLLTVREAKASKQLCASDYLRQLCNNNFEHGTSLILFSTPELVESNLSSLQQLANYKKLRQIVIDEFDVIAEARSNYRSAYLDLVQDLRKHCWPSTTFLFLSATATRQAILEVLPECTTKGMKPYLFLSRRPLLDNHVHVSHKRCNAKGNTSYAHFLHRLWNEKYQMRKLKKEF
jgi:superfamily II DNA helicase RecQ